ncbi:MAG: hypothetical protein RIB43_14280 [Rhodospirillaceae bacterium]
MIDFTSASCRKFYDHWTSLRGASDIPENSVFFDNAHPDYAPGTFMLELINETAVVRLMGTGLVEQWGHDQTGTIIGTAQSEGLEKAWYDNALTIVTHPCGMLVNSYFKSTQGRLSMIETIALPLVSPKSSNKRVVSYTEMIGDLGYKEFPDVWLETPKILWVDIGHSCPKEPPLDQ